MALQVWIPLHEDMTRVGGRTIDVDAIAEVLAGELSRKAARVWPELKRVYIDCVLANRNFVGGESIKFVKKSEQFSLECAVDMRPLVNLDAVEQAAAIFSRVAKAIEVGFSRKGKNELTRDVADFVSKLSPEFVSQLVYDHLRKDIAPESRVDTLHDLNTKIRHIARLSKSRGEVWLMLRVGSPHDQEAAARIIDEVGALVSVRSLGKRDGSSTGVFSSDVSFKVKSKSESGNAIIGMLDADHPDIDYIVSDATRFWLTRKQVLCFNSNGRTAQ